MCAGSCVHVSRVFISPIRKKNSAGRGLASPKACVGVWLLVLIVVLSWDQLSLDIFLFLVGSGCGCVRFGGRSAFVLRCGGGMSGFVLAYIRKDVSW